jgi:hypothetical protein
VFADVVARMRGRPKLRLNVFGACPETGMRVPTHAYMTREELRRFDRTLALFCPVCRRAHQFAAADLSLDPEHSVVD